jgi:hypothetical protein
MMKIQTSLALISVALMASGCASKTERQFISGCKTGGIDGSTCSCIYDKLEVNMERMDLKKISTPYNKLNPSRWIWSMFPISA